MIEKLRCAEVIDCQDALVSRNKRGKMTTQMSERSHCEVEKNIEHERFEKI